MAEPLLRRVRRGANIECEKTKERETREEDKERSGKGSVNEMSFGRALRSCKHKCQSRSSSSSSPGRPDRVRARERNRPVINRRGRTAGHSAKRSRSTWWRIARLRQLEASRFYASLMTIRGINWYD